MSLDRMSNRMSDRMSGKMSVRISETGTAETGISVEMAARPHGTPVLSHSNSYARTKFDDSDWVMRKISSLDSEYVKKHLGTPLTLALSEIVNRRPSDPIHYLGHWLLKWRWNQDQNQVQQDKLNDLLADRKRIAEEIEEAKRAEEEKIEQALREAHIEAEQIAQDIVNGIYMKLELPDLPEPVVPLPDEAEVEPAEVEDEEELAAGEDLLPEMGEGEELGDEALAWNLTGDNPDGEEPFVEDAVLAEEPVVPAESAEVQEDDQFESNFD